MKKAIVTSTFSVTEQSGFGLFRTDEDANATAYEVEIAEGCKCLMIEEMGIFDGDQVFAYFPLVGYGFWVSRSLLSVTESAEKAQ